MDIYMMNMPFVNNMCQFKLW